MIDYRLPIFSGGVQVVKKTPAAEPVKPSEPVVQQQLDITPVAQHFELLIEDVVATKESFC